MKLLSLNPGDTIGIFSPSRGITGEAPEATKRAVAFLEQNGYRVKLGNLTGKQDFYRSGSIADRAEEFNALLHDDSVNCLMASIGGYVSNSILPYIDYAFFRRIPKSSWGCPMLLRFYWGFMQKREFPPFMVRIL